MARNTVCIKCGRGGWVDNRMGICDICRSKSGEFKAVKEYDPSICKWCEKGNKKYLETGHCKECWDLEIAWITAHDPKWSGFKKV